MKLELGVGARQAGPPDPARAWMRGHTRPRITITQGALRQRVNASTRTQGAPRCAALAFVSYRAVPRPEVAMAPVVPHFPVHIIRRCDPPSHTIAVCIFPVLAVDGCDDDHQGRRQRD